MKRFFALVTALCILWASAYAEAPAGERSVELTGDGLTIYRVSATGEDDTLQYKVDYPAFESDDASLAAYLTGAVAEPLLALRRASPMATATAGAKDYTRVMFYASLDFPGILSLEATVLNRSADKTVNEILFFYRIIDLQNRKELTVYDLFTEPRDVVDKAIRSAVLKSVTAEGNATVSEVAQVPAPNSVKLTRDKFQCLYGAGTVSEKATTVNVPWADLALTRSPLLTGEVAGTVAAGEPAADETAVPEESAALQDTQTTAPESDAQADATEPVAGLTGDALQARLTASDWQAMGYTMRFQPDGTVIDPTGSDPLFVAYTLTDGGLSLSTPERADQAATVTEDTDGLSLLFDTETSDFDSLLLTPLAVQPTEASAQTAPPAAPSSAPVITPTPMPLTGEDADLASLLTQGLWKQIGSDGSTYYQFMPDGRLLTIQVSDYSLANGELTGGALSGTVLAGGTAFTLAQPDGSQLGFVLNRDATEVPAEAFVTASPTPMPTPSPTPSPTPEPSDSPTPSPTPEPTLSPYELAQGSAPTLAALSDATFDKRQTYKVYSAPDENSFRDSKAQVTTDETVQIFGVTGNWVLVGYQIGNGSRGRIGYIERTPLANPDSVAQIAFTNFKLKLIKKASATDDPLHGKTKLFELKKDTEVTLLAFLGSDWAYVETAYKDKPCRAFIPRSSLGSK